MPDWMAQNIVAVFGMLRQDPEAQVTGVVHALTGRQPRHLAEFLADHRAAFADPPPDLSGAQAAPASQRLYRSA